MLKGNGGGEDLGERKGGEGRLGRMEGRRETVVEMYCIREKLLKKLI